MATKTLSLRTRRNSRLHGRSRAGNILNFLFLALIGVFMALPDGVRSQQRLQTP